MSSFLGSSGGTSSTIAWDASTTSTGITVTSPLVHITGYADDVDGSQYDGGNESVYIKQAQTGVKRIGPKLYFSYVKSKLTEPKQKDLRKRLAVLKKEMDVCADIGQVGLYEELSKEILRVVKESELYVMGVKIRIEKKDIKRFMRIVSEPGKEPQYNDKIIHFEKLENFPRPIPEDIRKKIKSVKKRELFDDLWILYLDYTGKAKAKTTKDKIREKDPILFGSCKECGDTMYYIADWIDDQCDLTLDKILDCAAAKIESSSIPDELSRETLEEIKADIEARAKALKETNMGNFTNKMKEQDEITADMTRGMDPDENMPFWKKFIRFFG